MERQLHQRVQQRFVPAAAQLCKQCVGWHIGKSCAVYRQRNAAIKGSKPPPLLGNDLLKPQAAGRIQRIKTRLPVAIMLCKIRSGAHIKPGFVGIFNKQKIPQCTHMAAAGNQPGCAAKAHAILPAAPGKLYCPTVAAACGMLLKGAAFQMRAESQALRFGSAKMNGNDIGLFCDDEFAFKENAAALIANARKRIVDVEFPAVLRIIRMVRKRQAEIAKRR